jgi:hypothetical protein
MGNKQNGKTQKLSPNMFLVVNEPEEQEFSLEQSKFQQNTVSSWRLHGFLSNFQIFLAGQQSELTKKIKNSAPNMFLAMNEPEEQETEYSSWCPFHRVPRNFSFWLIFECHNGTTSPSLAPSSNRKWLPGKT